MIKVERGDPTVAVGTMFEAATLVGVSLFEGADGERAHYGALRRTELATCVDLAHRIRAEFVRPDATLRELFGRIAFNIPCGNTDGHGRNQAAFVDGPGLALTPAFGHLPAGPPRRHGRAGDGLRPRRRTLVAVADAG